MCVADHRERLLFSEPEQALAITLSRFNDMPAIGVRIVNDQRVEPMHPAEKRSLPYRRDEDLERMAVRPVGCVGANVATPS